MTGIGVSILRDHISKGGYDSLRASASGFEGLTESFAIFGDVISSGGLDLTLGSCLHAGLPESQRTRVTGSIKSFEWDMLRIPACFQAFGLSSLCRFYVKSEQSSFFTRSCNPETNPGGFESFFRHLNSSCGTSVCPMMSWLSMRGARVSAYPPVVEMQGPEP